MWITLQVQVSDAILFIMHAHGANVPGTAYVVDDVPGTAYVVDDE